MKMYLQSELRTHQLIDTSLGHLRENAQNVGLGQKCRGRVGIGGGQDRVESMVYRFQL